MKKYNWMLMLLSCFFVQHSWASIAMNPEKCPSVAAIQSLGMNESNIEPVDNVWWATHKQQNYDTNNDWWMIMMMKVTDKAEALSIAKNALNVMTYNEGPIESTQLPGLWVCIYNSSGVFADNIFLVSSETNPFNVIHKQSLF